MMPFYIILFVVCIAIFGYLEYHFYKSPNCYILITDEDKKRKEILEKKESKNNKNLFGFVVITILLSIIAAFIYDILKYLFNSI
jgi:hypothetical protein